MKHLIIRGVSFLRTLAAVRVILTWIPVNYTNWNEKNPRTRLELFNLKIVSCVHVIGKRFIRTHTVAHINKLVESLFFDPTD